MYLLCMPEPTTWSSTNTIGEKRATDINQQPTPMVHNFCVFRAATAREEHMFGLEEERGPTEAGLRCDNGADLVGRIGMVVSIAALGR